MRVWIVVFSVLVFIALYQLHNTQNANHQDRLDRDSAILQSQIAGCERGNARFKKILDLIASNSVTDKKLTPLQRDVAVQKVKDQMATAGYYAAATVSCKTAVTTKQTTVTPDTGT